MRRLLTALVAAGALVLPGAALATHATDVDGPAVSSINGICHSEPGQAWYAAHANVFITYWRAMLSAGPSTAAGQVYYRLAMEHYGMVAWFRAACS